uniref:Nucleoprotein n=1 Tax=Vinca chlorotic spot virus TaxID=3076770 RepID=A0AA96KH82_9RHAB|nr:nucleocapsid [Vinca chlorotic spot virus]
MSRVPGVTTIDYMEVNPAFSAVPPGHQVATSAPTPITYARNTAVTVPIISISAPSGTAADVVTRFDAIMENASSSLTKAELVELMSMGFSISPPGLGGPAMMAVAQGAVTQEITMGQITATFDSRAAAAGATINIDPEEMEEDTSGKPREEVQESADSKAAAVTYICLSLHRLCIKEVGAFLKGVRQLKDSYHVLMGVHSQYMQDFQYTRGLCENVSSLFNQCDDLKKTLAHHCAVADETYSGNRTVHGPLRFLILQHMDLTGMVPYGMYIDMKMGLPLLEPGLLLTWLGDAHVNSVLNLIAEINMKHDLAASTDRFWRYSRSLNPGFFLGLQQSKCYILIARMADILVRSGITRVTEYSDPRNSKILADKPAIRAQAEQFGQEFWIAYNSLAGTGEGAGPVAKALAREAQSGTRIQRNLHARPVQKPVIVNAASTSVAKPPAGALDAMVTDN